MQAPWWWSKTETCRSDIYAYFNVNFNVFLKIKMCICWWVNSTNAQRCSQMIQRFREYTINIAVDLFDSLHSTNIQHYNKPTNNIVHLGSPSGCCAVWPTVGYVAEDAEEMLSVSSTSKRLTESSAGLTEGLGIHSHSSKFKLTKAIWIIKAI